MKRKEVVSLLRKENYYDKLRPRERKIVNLVPSNNDPSKCR